MTALNIDSKYRMLSGYEIPVLGFGMYQTPAREAADVVQHALKVGYRHVDSAVAYHNEQASVDGLKKSGLAREDVFFTTKIPPNSLNYEGTKKQIETSLRITGYDYIDLYLLHVPWGGKENRLGAWKALVEGVEEGKIRSIGVSNYGVHHLDELEEYIKSTDEKEGPGKGGVLSVNQVELHPWLARKDIVDWCEKRGVILQAYSPLVKNTKANDPLLVPLTKKHGKTAAQILLRWSLQKGFVPLPKSVTKSRIEENTQIYDFELDDDDMKALDTGVHEPCVFDATLSD